MVYVISKNDKPLMPTKNHAKVRILLKNKKAKVITSNPFTIKLLYDSKEYIQSIKLGIDSGYTYIGFSATTEKEELISGEVKLLQGMKQRLEDRSSYRKQRRRRLRHRKPRFNNRIIPKGWLAPSIKHKIDSHAKFIECLKTILPITSITIEIANFDIQKIKNPDISGKEYQEGEQKDFFNLREYVLHRDKHTCQYCGATDIPLQVHHLNYWKGSKANKPSELIALCIKCHLPKNHKEGGFLYGWMPKIKSFREATFMTLVRKKLVCDLNCNYTYGYETKSKRIEISLPKTHYNDAFVIAGGANQKRAKVINFKQIKRNNRCLEKFYDAKFIDIRTTKKVSAQELPSGRRVRNANLNSENLRIYRGKKLSKGRRSIRKQRYPYQPGDLVRYQNQIYTVRGTQNKGTYVALREIKKVAKVTELTPYKFCKGIKAI